MLYVLYGQDYDSFKGHGVYEGPAGLDVSKLHDKFMSQFDHRGLGQPKYPDYKGPYEKQKPVMKKSKTTSCSSGAFMENDWSYPLPDKDSKEYKAWLKEYKRIDEEWNAKRDARIKAVCDKYGSKDLFSCFLAMLLREHGLRKVEAEWVNI